MEGGQIIGGDDRRHVRRIDVQHGQLRRAEVEQDAVRLEQTLRPHGATGRQPRHRVREQLPTGGVQPGHDGDVGVEVDHLPGAGRQLQQSHRAQETLIRCTWPSPS